MPIWSRNVVSRKDNLSITMVWNASGTSTIVNTLAFHYFCFSCIDVLGVISKKFSCKLWWCVAAHHERFITSVIINKIWLLLSCWFFCSTPADMCEMTSDPTHWISCRTLGRTIGMAVDDCCDTRNTMALLAVLDLLMALGFDLWKAICLEISPAPAVCFLQISLLNSRTPSLKIRWELYLTWHST